MESSEFIDKYGAPLPRSIVTVIGAVRALDEFLCARGDGPRFPELQKMPFSDTEVEKAIGDAAAWATHVRLLLGIGQRQRVYGGRGILPMFGPRSKFADAEEPSRLLGEIPEHLAADRRTYEYFEWVFHSAGERVQGCARSLTDPAFRGIEFTTPNWPQLRSKLDQGHTQIRVQAEAMLGWVLGRLHSVYGWAPSRSTTSERRLQESTSADDRVAIARKALEALPEEWVSREDLKRLGIPPTAVDQHFKTDLDRFREDKRAGGSRGRVEYRKRFVVDYVRRVWRPRDRT